ncbi:MAG TPA: hypothetical protein VK857_00020 [Desulforhopalus sp.]|nr:hypothetical protein [Desulforhopalus sp.]
MRCPKCGYISFDHLETCLKCKKDIKSAADAVPGSVFNVVTPVFLRFDREVAGKQDDEELVEAEMAEEMELEDEDLEDEDLEVLIADPQEEEQGKRVITRERDAVAGREDEEEKDREIDFDLSQFEESAKRAETAPTESGAENLAPGAGVAPVIEIPEELADISDLAPPGRDTAPATPADIVTEQEAATEGLSDLRLDDLDLDLRLDDLDGEAEQHSLGETVLSLDELDFTETLPKSDSPAVRSKRQEMDDELNFDLDLGGLSIDKDK